MKMEVLQEEPAKKKLKINNKLDGKKKKVQLEKSEKLSQKSVPKSEEILEKRRERRKEKRLARQNKKNSKNKQKVVIKINNIGEKLLAIIKNEKDNDKTKINHYRNLLNKVDEKNLEEFSLKTKEIILNEKLDDDLKIYLINNLTKLINLSFYKNNFEVLLILAKFCVSKFINQNNLNDVDQNFKNPTLKLITLLINNVMNKKTKEHKKEVLDLIYKIMKYAYKLNEEDESNDLYKENLNKIFKKIFSSYKSIELNEKNEKEKIFLAFFLFYVFVCINYLNENETTLSLFLEINECFKRFSKNENEDEKPYWSDVFTDILLSLLSKPNNFKRSICDEVFNLIADKITQDGLELLMTALLSDSIEDDLDEEIEDENEDENEKKYSDEENLDDKENTKDKNAEEDSSDEEVLDMDIDENLKDVDQKFEYNEDEESEKDEEASEESDSEDDLNETESEAEDVDDDLRNKIKLALGKAAADDDDDDELVFDDEQMFKLDDAIANVFKEKKKVQEKNKNQDLNEFKSRCFDLVLILINTKTIKLDFLLKTAKTILEVLSKNSKNNCYDLLLKASSTLKKYPNLEKLSLNNNENHEEEIKSLVEGCLKLSVNMPEKIRNNLNSFLVWVLDLSKSLNIEKTMKTIVLNEVEFILDNKKINLVYLFLTIIERKKNYSELVFDKLDKLDINNDFPKFKICSFYRLINECFVNFENELLKKLKSKLDKILIKSLDLLEKKKNDKKSKFLIEEIIKFLIIYIKKYKDDLIKEDISKNRLIKLKEELVVPKLNKNLRKKWNSVIKCLI